MCGRASLKAGVVRSHQKVSQPRDDDVSLALITRAQVSKKDTAVVSSANLQTTSRRRSNQFLSSCFPDRFSVQPGRCNRYALISRHFARHLSVEHREKKLTTMKQVRRYASGAPPNGGNKGVLYTSIAAAGLAGTYLYLRGGDSPAGRKGRAPEISTAPAKPAFTGGDQGFVSLLLEKSEIVNHNTKKLTFKLPEDDMESGLPVTCTCR